MGYRAHVQTKHVIEYGNCHFNWQSDEIHDWLVDNGAYIYGDAYNDYDGDCEWELDKDQLRAIPESAYRSIGEGDDEITAQELRDFVQDCLNAPTGQYAFVSWF